MTGKAKPCKEERRKKNGGETMFRILAERSERQGSATCGRFL